MPRCPTAALTTVLEQIGVLSAHIQLPIRTVPALAIRVLRRPGQQPEPVLLGVDGTRDGVREGARVRRHLPLLLAVGLIGLRIATVSAALTETWPYQSATSVNSDVGRYHQIAASRGTPYRDFQVEQAPVTLGLIEVLNDSSQQAMQTRLMLSQLALDLIVAGLLVWGWGRRAGFAYLILGVPFALYPFLYLRLDLLSVALAIGALALVHRRRAVSGGVLLAVAALAKLWSIVLVPSFVVTRNWRAWTGFIVTFGAGLIAWIAWAPDGPRQVLTYRGARGWQIESSIGVLVHAVSHARVRFERGSMRVGDVPSWARFSLLMLGAVLVLAVWVLAARVRTDRHRVVDSIGPLAAISGLLITSTLLSPQYASWLLPFAAIGVVFGDRLLAGLAGAIAALSVVDLLMLHELAIGDPVALTVVIVRNVLILALYVVAVGRLWKLAAVEAPRVTDRWRDQLRVPPLAS